jgi:hypothetical protein
VKGHLVMSQKELRRLSVFEQVKAGQKTLKVAADVLGLSYRQCRRSYKRFVAQGEAGLVHGNRGRPSNRRKPEQFKQQVLDRYKHRYKPLDFGPTLAAEKLSAEGLAVHPETLRRWTLAAHLRQKRCRRASHRSWREPKAHFGQLVQMDGSHHRWFGPEQPQACLMTMVDDATGTTLALMDTQETTSLAMRALWAWIERYGIPRALYTDRKNVFITDREPTLEEQLAGEEPKTAFGKACETLGITIITAHSPQAKGRVERKHQVFQDRFLKELALKRITRISTANTLLCNGFVEGLNEKFAKAPRHPQDYHRPLPQGICLQDVFCFEQTRVVQNDWTLRFENQHYQILETNHVLPRPKEKVLVRIRLDETLHLLYRGQELEYIKLTAQQLSQRQGERPPPQPPSAPPKETDRRRPADHHPWRRGYPLMTPENRK